MADAMNAVEYRESWRVLLVLKLWPLALVAMGLATAAFCWPIPAGVAVGAMVVTFGTYLLIPRLFLLKAPRPGLRLNEE